MKRYMIGRKVMKQKWKGETFVAVNIRRSDRDQGRTHRRLLYQEHPTRGLDGCGRYTEHRIGTLAI